MARTGWRGLSGTARVAQTGWHGQGGRQSGADRVADRVARTEWHGQSGADRMARWDATKLPDTRTPVVSVYAN